MKSTVSIVLAGIGVVVALTALLFVLHLSVPHGALNTAAAAAALPSPAAFEEGKVLRAADLKALVQAVAELQSQSSQPQSSSGLKPLPSKYVYNVLSKNPDAPYPGNRIEFFISLNGSDAPGVTGLTPDDAFRTGQHCIDYVYNTYYIGSSQAEVFCRYMGTGTSQPAVYYENVQPTGNMAGAQGIAGTIPMFIGTMGMDGPWDSKVGSYYGDARDVIIDSTRTAPYHCGTNYSAKPCTTFAGINGTVFGILGLTIKSSSGFANVSASAPGTVIMIGASTLKDASVGLQAVSGGQIIVIADMALASTIPTLVDVQGSPSSFYWAGGTLHLRRSSIDTFASVSKMGFADFAGLKFDSETGTVTTSCVINGNSVLSASGATLPGPGTCAPSSGGQLLP